MNCSRFETLISDYLDETLDRRVHEAISVHAERCPDCASLLQEVRDLQQELAYFPTLEPPEDLVDRILERTSGKPQKRSLWKDLVIPTVNPFLTQRYAFATVMMFVFLSLMVNLWGPGFSALSASQLRPSTIIDESYRFSNQIYKRWMQVKDFRTRLFEEIRLLKEDLYSRLDYHLIAILFESYSESLERQQKQPEETLEEQPEQLEEDRNKP